MQMSCAEFLGACVGNCTDNTKFKDACDTCPPDTCAGFLGSCVGNCTDDSAFEDACMKSCEMSFGQWVITIIVYIGIAYCLYKSWKYYNKRDEDRQFRYSTAVPQVPQVPQARVIAVDPNIPELQGTIVPNPPLKQGSIYPQKQLTREDVKNLRNPDTKQIDKFITHDGWIVQKKDLKIVGQTRYALNQPTVF